MFKLYAMKPMLGSRENQSMTYEVLRNILRA